MQHEKDFIHERKASDGSGFTHWRRKLHRRSAELKTGSVTRRPASLKHSSQNEPPPGSDLRRSATETGPGSRIHCPPDAWA